MYTYACPLNSAVFPGKESAPIFTTDFSMRWRGGGTIGRDVWKTDESEEEQRRTDRENILGARERIIV